MAEAVAEGEKASALAEDLWPLVDLCSEVVLESSGVVAHIYYMKRGSILVRAFY